MLFRSYWGAAFPDRDDTSIVQAYQVYVRPFFDYLVKHHGHEDDHIRGKLNGDAAVHSPVEEILRVMGKLEPCYDATTQGFLNDAWEGIQAYVKQSFKMNDSIYAPNVMYEGQPLYCVEVVAPQAWAPELVKLVKTNYAKYYNVDNTIHTIPQGWAVGQKVHDCHVYARNNNISLVDALIAINKTRTSSVFSVLDVQRITANRGANNPAPRQQGDGQYPEWYKSSRDKRSEERRVGKECRSRGSPDT